MVAPCMVAVDIGGTFTDVVALRGRTVTTAKVDTVPGALHEGVMAALAKVGASSLANCSGLVHGTTVVINAIVERRGATTGLITNAGFRDVLEIGRGDRPDFFNLEYRKPAPFVPRHLRMELPGRMSYHGEELAPLDLSPLPQILGVFDTQGVEAIAICLLHSYANPAHEQRAAEAIRKARPNISVVASHEICREWREFERSSTAALSAYIAPRTRGYLKGMRDSLRSVGLPFPPHIMQSNGGLASLSAALARPITLLESGPAAGMWAAAALGSKIGHSNVIALDIGGTTAKASLVEGGMVTLSTEYHLECTPKNPGYPVLVPVVDIVEIGSGGGSLAFVDKFGRLTVGPESAGADPGPAACGRSERATTTDALLSLGQISASFFCGGEVKVDEVAVENSLQRLAAQLGLDTRGVARGIVRLANSSMVNALKLVSVNRGHDPRDFALIAFGGGGGLHAGALARALSMRTVVIPLNAAVFSALGMLMSDERRDFIRTAAIALTDAPTGIHPSDKVSALVREMQAEAREELLTEGRASASPCFEVFARLKYRNQTFDLEVPITEQLSDGWQLQSATVPLVMDAFRAAYQRRYLYTLDKPVDLVNIRVVAVVRVHKFELQPSNGVVVPLQATVKGAREVDFIEDGVRVATVYDGTALHHGHRFDGPAIVESPDTTVVINPGMTAQVDEFGNLIIDTSPTSPTLDSLGHTHPPEKRQRVAATEEQSLTCGNAGPFDPITDEIIRSALTAIADEMFHALRRTALSTIITEVLDMGTAVLDRQGNISCSGAGIPAFVGVLDKALAAVLRKFPAASVASGDVFVLNDPYEGGVTHLNDVVFCMPAFATGELCAWACAIAHISDVGGRTAGSMATDAEEVFEEGLRIPPVKIVSRGECVQGILDILHLNSRTPEYLDGDLWACIAAVRVGVCRLEELATKYGLRTCHEAMQRGLDLGEAETLAALQTLPRGTFKLCVPREDGPGNFRTNITISDTELCIDLRDNDDQEKSPFNISRDAAVVAAQMLLKGVTGGSRLSNAGTFRPLRVLTRKGSIFEPHAPAAQSFYYETMITLVDVLWRTLAQAMPDRLPAGHFASICGIIVFGQHPDSNSQYVIIEPELGGWGATARGDGNNCVYSSMHGCTYNCPAEVAETRNGLLVDQVALNPESGGHGKFRGGKGVIIDYVVRADARLTFSYSHAKQLPWPLAEGMPGTANYVQVWRSNGGWSDRLSSATGLELAAGDRFRVVTGCGAGWGDPKDRDANSVKDDVRKGYISLEDAQDIYGYEAFLA